MDLGLTGKTALVLGASRGLGAAIARALAREGAEVVGGARSAERIAAWAEEWEDSARLRIRGVAVDLGDRASVNRLANDLLTRGGVDIMINNSGGPPPGPVTEIEPDAWLRQFESMAANLFELTRRLLPPMRERRWGRILTIASSGIEQPIPNLGLSNALRAAVAGWSKTLAHELAPFGITVNLVLPGRIATERVAELDRAAAERQGNTVAEIEEASRATIPVGRYGSPDELAAVVAFLAGRQASYVTGSKIRVDGGLIRSV